MNFTSLISELFDGVELFIQDWEVRQEIVLRKEERPEREPPIQTAFIHDLHEDG